MSEAPLAEILRQARESGCYEALLARMPYARFLGVRIERHGDILRSHLPYRPVLIGNPALPALHGGVTAAFMENAAMLHLLLQPGQDRIPKIIDFAIDYLLPGRPQDCYAECRVARAGLRIAQTQIRCWQGDPDRPIAIARAHFLLASP
ncbi:uncharacterized domain 1-containing protein [Fontimonas thermophila]|uniref:Uncharacterized domain 1-containing protein n=1 Tax=Fontimonas thermophila TaxID=1076937 RepID=A0A1I2HWD5_9GAMM|nr:PaaI family thioesterase [Fontimonas thermophila]SFF33763.1 uncharacterized domain 1-containing protein [Fontimonas thermophila]